MNEATGNRRRTTSTLLTALLVGVLTLSATSQLKASIFSYNPIPEQDIISASFSVDLAALVAHRTVLGQEVNMIRLVDPTGALPDLDLSDAFFGTATWPNPPQINMGNVETGITSVGIDPSFFPVLAAGTVDGRVLLTDTDDALFAFDFLSLTIDTTTRGSIVSLFGTDNGFGLGIADGANLPAAMPGVLPPTGFGSGEDKELSSIFIIPEPTTLLFLAVGVPLLLRRRRFVDNHKERGTTMRTRIARNTFLNHRDWFCRYCVRPGAARVPGAAC